MGNLIHLTEELCFTLIDLINSFLDNYESEISEEVDKEIYFNFKDFFKSILCFDFDSCAFLWPNASQSLGNLA